MIRTTLRNVLVIAFTTVAVLGCLLLVQQPWRDGGEVDAPTASTSIDVPMIPGQAAPAVGQPATGFTSVGVDGRTITLDDFRGRPVWLVFGTTWCANCRAEAPDVQAVAEEFEGRAVVVTVYVGESTATVREYADRLGLTHPQIADSTKAISSVYAVMGIPTHVFINGEGVIQEIMVGALTRQGAAEVLDSLL